MGDASKSDLVRSCGCVSTKKDASEHLNFTAFYEALLEDKGMTIGGGVNGKRPGRQISYVTKIQFNGNLLVSKAYTAQLGLKPGDEFEIKLGRNQIQLIPLVTAEEEGVKGEFDPRHNSGCSCLRLNTDKRLTDRACTSNGGMIGF